MPKKVSVIVPVYNTEKYLEECLSSLTGQTLEETEIIVVNDGSPDNSQEIIDRYAAEYPEKVVALEQENRGLGPARNSGIEAARGEYVGFVDSDDWVRPDMFELLYKAAVNENADVVICDLNIMNDLGDRCVFSQVYQAGKEGLQTVAEYVLAASLSPTSCNKLFRRELAQSIPFPDIFAEDVATIPVIFSYSTKITYLPQPLYYYRKRLGSATTLKDSPRRAEIIKAWQRCMDDCNPAYRKEMEHAVYFSVLDTLVTFKKHTELILEFLWENEDSFRRNKYIQAITMQNPAIDLICLTDITEATGDSLTPLTQNLLDLLRETVPLVEQLDELPEDTVAELRDIYDYAVQTAAGSVTKIGLELRLLTELSRRRKRIRERPER